MNAALGKRFLVGNILYEVESSQRNAAGEERRDKTIGMWGSCGLGEQESKKGRCWEGHGADIATMTTVSIVPTHSRQWPAGSWIT